MISAKHALIAGLALAGFALTACGGDDPPPPEPETADLRFYHAVLTLGSLDLTVNDETVTVAPATLSDTIEVEPGAVSFEMLNPGAAAPIFESNLGQLAAGPHAFIITEAGDDYRVFEAGTNPPIEQEGLYHFQVVNLSELDREVYFNSTDTPDVLSPLDASPFYSVTVAELPVNIDTFNVGDDPATDAPAKRFRITSEDELTAPLTLLLLGYDDGAAEWTFTPVEL